MSIMSSILTEVLFNNLVSGLRLILYFIVTTHGYCFILRFFLFFCFDTVIFISVISFFLVQLLKLDFGTFWSYYESIYSSISVDIVVCSY
jgi:hypothetical protein